MIVVLLAAALRLHRLDTESLWLDETFSVALARGPVDTLISEVAEDVHPPFYFLLLSAWFQFTEGSAWSARLLSVLCSLGIVGAAFALGRRWSDARTGGIAALLLAISPFQVEFAQEARMYALLALTASLSTLALSYLGSTAHAREDEAHAVSAGPLLTPAWLAYVLASSLMVYTHAAGVFVLGAHGLAVLLARWRSRGAVRLVDRWSTALIVVGALFVPWLGTFLTQFSAVQAGFWVPRPTWRNLADPIVAFAGSPLLAWIVGALACWGTWSLARGRRGRHQPAGAAVLTLWLLVTALAPFALSLVGSSVFLPKYTIAGSVPLAVLAAAGLASLARLPRAAALVVVALLSSGALYGYYEGMPRKDDWRRAVREIERDSGPGDVVVVYPYFLEFPLRVYATRQDLTLVPFPRHAAATTAPTLGVMLDGLTRDAPRVRLVVMEYDARRGMLADRLHARFDRVEAHRYGHVDVFTFSDPAQGSDRPVVERPGGAE